MKQKSKIKLLRPDRVWQPKVGGDHGCRKALKTGLHTREIRDLKRRIAAWRRTVRAVLNAAAPKRRGAQNDLGRSGA